MKCTSCGGRNLEFIYKFSDAPVLNNVFFTTKAAAQKARKGVITLHGCKTCGLVFNTSFNEKWSHYTGIYDNTQNASPYFSTYMQKLARRLFKKYRLKDKRVVEVGCGKGQFLELFYDLGVRHIQGFDPTYTNYKPKIDQLIVRKYFNKNNIRGKVDVIICRHTLEHIPRLREFVKSVSQCLAKDGVMYFEIPDLSWIVKNKTFFDFTYEHCNYFTPHSLHALFSQFGFGRITFKQGLGGQYIQAEVRRGVPKKTKTRPIRFEAVKKSIELDREYAENTLKRFGRFIVWGAGGKGVFFLNRLQIQSPFVIDINKNKQNKYIPGTAQRVVSPEILRKEKIDAIIIMNPIYAKEIREVARNQNFRGKFIEV